jgi:hypothetical protein
MRWYFEKGEEPDWSPQMRRFMKTRPKFYRAGGNAGTSVIPPVTTGARITDNGGPRLTDDGGTRVIG